MGTAIKSMTFIFTKNAQNCSKRIIGQKIDIQILPKRILIRIFEYSFEPYSQQKPA